MKSKKRIGMSCSVQERTLQLLAVATVFSVQAFAPSSNGLYSNSGRRMYVSPPLSASVTTNGGDVFSSDGSPFDGSFEEQNNALYDKLSTLSSLGGSPSLGKQGLSKFHQSILSRSTVRQRLVTGKDPLRITVEDNPTRKWLGLGRDETAATAHLLVNGTTVERSAASFDRFQWIDDDERQELHERYAMVSLELIAEVHIKKPGYLNVLPSTGAGSSAALRRAVDKSTAWNRYTGGSTLLDEIDGSRNNNKDRLWVSGFSLASQRGYLHSVDAETGHIESVNRRTRKSVLWPNEFNTVPVIRDMRPRSPDNVVEKTTDAYDDALLVSDGFLVPGKNKGGIYVVKNPGNSGTEWTTCLTGGSTNHHDAWFYHRAVWVDLTGDGRKSVLTARAKSPSLLKNGQSVTRNANQKGQLVWLEMPKPHSIDEETGTPLEKDGTLFDPFSARHTPWKEHVLDEGPDVMFAVADLDTTDDSIEVIASQFFDKKVSLSSIQRGTKPKVTFRRTIDDKCGSAFASIFADLDCNYSNESKERIVLDSGSTVETCKPGDSLSHLLVTSHECSFANDAVNGEETNPSDDSVDGGSLFAYRIPSGKNAWKTEPWVRTTVASGFRVKGQLGNVINPGAPGFCYTFHPKKGEENSGKRPLIAIAGDCAESAYILRPIDNDESTTASSFDANANYKLMCEIECGATVGSIAVGYDDFCSTEQQSGFAKLYIPCYEKDKVLVFAMGDGEDDMDLDSGW